MSTTLRDSTEKFPYAKTQLAQLRSSFYPCHQWFPARICPWQRRAPGIFQRYRQFLQPFVCLHRHSNALPLRSNTRVTHLDRESAVLSIHGYHWSTTLDYATKCFQKHQDASPDVKWHELLSTYWMLLLSKPTHYDANTETYHQADHIWICDAIRLNRGFEDTSCTRGTQTGYQSGRLLACQKCNDEYHNDIQCTSPTSQIDWLWPHSHWSRRFNYQPLADYIQILNSCPRHV